MILLVADFNLPYIDWDILEIKEQCRNANIHKLLETAQDYFLSQLNRHVIRESNSLDILLTNAPNLVSRVETLPGITDHHAIFTEINTITYVNQKQPRKIFLHKQTDKESFKVDLTKFQINFDSMIATKNANELRK